jgi:ABC-type sugar transport system, periplasmic component
MRKLRNILLVFTMVFGLAACGGGGSTPSAEQKSIVVMTPNATHGFTGQSVSDAQEGTKRLAEENNMEYKVVVSANATEQASQIEQIVSEAPDVVVLWPHDDTLKSAAQTLVDADIPVIIYDRLLDNFAQVSEVMGDNVKIGEETGNYFNDFFADDNEVFYIEFKGDNSSVPGQRSDGFASTIDSKFVSLGQWSTDWQRAKGQSIMEEFMGTADFVKVEAIFTHDAEVALGVLTALEGYSGDHNVKLVSAVSEPKQLLDQIQHYSDLGIEVVTYTFNPNMVVEAVRIAIEHANGASVPAEYLIPTEAIDVTNYTEFTGWGQ